MSSQPRFLVNFRDRLINLIISPIDNAVATPVNNYEFINDIETQHPYPGPNAKDPYPDINNSPNASFYAGGALITAILAILFTYFIGVYKNLRKKEGLSPAFFFETLPHIEGWLKNHGNETEYLPEVLLASAHYYNPDLSSWILWWRRKWAWLRQSRNYLELQKYQKKEALKGETKKDITRALYKKILEVLALYITDQGKYGQWIVKEIDGNLIIRPMENTEDLSYQILQTFNAFQSNAQEQDIHQKKSISQKILGFIDARLDELGTASYVFWIIVFAFFFLAGIGVIGGVVWPPILAAGIVWVVLLTTKIYQTIKQSFQHKQAKINPNYLIENKLFLKEKEKEKNTFFLLQTIRHQIQLEALKKEKISFKDSKLKKSIEKTLRRESDTSLIWPIFNGFIKGFFTVLFSFWLLTAILGLVVTLNPIGAAILAIVTLALGIAYGLYTAMISYQVNNVNITNREKQWLELKAHCQEKVIPDISLEEYDRLLRRNRIDKTLWTSIKQFFKRTWVGFTRMGAGILFLKLTALGPATTICLALGIAASTAFLPGLLLAGGLIFVAWHLYQYHLESEQNKIDNIIQSLSYQSFIESISPLNTDKNLIPQDFPQALSSDLAERDKPSFTITQSWNDERNSLSNQKPEFLHRGNLINVATQNNFCGYYALARRIINDKNFGTELLDKFNVFYKIHWKKGQLAEVLKNMYPAQADALLGIVFYEQRKLEAANKGLYIDELSIICKNVGYDLYSYMRENPNDLSDINLADFTSLSPLGLKKIYVLFDKKDPKENFFTHYYLLEPDDIKATHDASQRENLNLSEKSYLYTINNTGSNTEEFIQNITLSVTNIDQQINPKMDPNKLLQQDERFAWLLAIEEIESLKLKKTLFNFKRQLHFFQEEFCSQLASEEKKYVCELQKREFEFYASQKISL